MATALVPAASWYPSTTGYALVRAEVVSESRLRVVSRGGIHDCTSVRVAAISLPRKRIALTLSGTALGIIEGTNPRAVYRKTTTESPGNGTGLKNPVSVLLRGSMTCR